MGPAYQSTAGGPDTRPFKRKIASREPPKRSSRQTAIKKQKTLVEREAKHKKARSRQ